MSGATDMQLILLTEVVNLGNLGEAVKVKDSKVTAMVAAKLANITHGGNRKHQDANLHLEVSRSDAADMLNVSPRTVGGIDSLELSKRDTTT